MNAIRVESPNGESRDGGLSSRFDLGAELACDEGVSIGDVVLAAANRSFAERQALEKRAEDAEYEALHDDVTGLLNKKGLHKFVDEWAHEEGAPLDTRIVFVAVDINGLKKTNDTKGHQEGDKLLYSVATMLQDIATEGLRESDVVGVARMGEKGDEFFIILTARTTLRGGGVQPDIHESERVVREKINTLIRIKDETKQFSLGLYVTNRQEVMDNSGYLLALERADDEMMKNKRRLYAEMGDQTAEM